MMQNDTHNTPTPFVADGYQTVEVSTYMVCTYTASEFSIITNNNNTHAQDTLNILHREDLLQAELDNDGQDVWGDQV